MTDHYTEANRLIDGLHNLEGHNADFDMALAQVHATLALAEQQRIANLIALYVGDSKNHPAGGEFADACYSRLADPDSIKALRIETT